MKARVIAVASALLLAVGGFSPTPPAAANGCVGTGVLVTGVPLTYPVSFTPSVGLHQPPWSVFNLSTTGGACLPTLKTFGATGVFNGWCGLNSGAGTTNTGHRFAWVNVGTVMVFTGGLVGVASVVPDTLNGESCLSGADVFLVTYGAAKVGCTVAKTKQLLPIPVPPHLLTVQGVAVHSDGFHMWLKVCIGGK